MRNLTEGTGSECMVHTLKALREPLLADERYLRPTAVLDGLPT